MKSGLPLAVSLACCLVGRASGFKLATNFSLSSVNWGGGRRRFLSEEDRIHVHFEAYGLEFDYDLEKSAPAFSLGARSVMASTGNELPVEPKPSYRDQNRPHKGSAALTLVKSDGSAVDGLFVLDNGRQFHLFYDTASESMVVVEDVDEDIDGFGCGEPITPPAMRRRMMDGLVARGQAAERVGHSYATHELPRRLSVERWSDCFTGDEQVNSLGIGIAVDFTYYQQVGQDLDALESEIAAIVDNTNFLYERQLNVRLSVLELFVADSTGVLNSGGNSDWNNCNPPPAHPVDPIYGQLGKFQDWVDALPMNNDRGLWHLLTDCHPPPGVVGVAYVGVICQGWGYNSGVTSKTWDRTWKTFAHEIGHNFGAGHSFEEGQGSTGGIMDYGDGKLNGEYQFNTQYRKAEICNELSQISAAGCKWFNEYMTASPTTAQPTSPTMTPSLAPTSAPTTAGPTSSPTTAGPTAVPTHSPTLQPTMTPTQAPTSLNDLCLAIPSSKKCTTWRCSTFWCNSNPRCQYVASAPAFKRCLSRVTEAPTAPTTAPTTAAPTAPTSAPTLSPTSVNDLCLGVPKKFRCRNSRCSIYRCNRSPLCMWDSSQPPFKKCISRPTEAPTAPTTAPTTSAPTAPTPSPTLSQNQICARLKGRNAYWTSRNCNKNSLCVSKRIGRRTVCAVKPPTPSPTTAAPTTALFAERSLACEAATVYKPGASFASVNKLTSASCNKIEFAADSDGNSGDYASGPTEAPSIVNTSARCVTKLYGKKLKCMYIENI